MGKDHRHRVKHTEVDRKVNFFSFKKQSCDKIESMKRGINDE